MIFLRNKITLCELCKHFDFKINQVVEVGLGEPRELRSRCFIDAGIDVTLIEPHPKFYGQNLMLFGDKPNVKLFNVAIGEKNEMVDFYLNESSSFIGTVDQPPTVTDGHYDKSKGYKIKVESCVWDERFDDGKIDVALLDTEGSEYFVIKNMISRPKILGIEIICENRYRNPYLDEIQTWLEENTYKVLFITTTDGYFIRGDDLGWGKGGIRGWRL